MKKIISKTIKMNRVVLLALGVIVSITMASCVQDDDFAIPTPVLDQQEPVMTGTQVTFKSVMERFQQSGGMATYDVSEDVYIMGYVVSDDRSGNFYEELIVQNRTDDATSTEDPRMGLRIDINQSDLNNKYNFGRRVYIKLSGLSVTEDSGVLAVGKLDQNGELGQIESLELDDVIFRSTETLQITPKSTTLSNLIPEDLNTFIQLDQMQFSATSVGKTFAGEGTDQFDGERLMESCVDGETVILSTSTFSNFKSEIVPNGSGTLTAIYSKNFFGDTDVLVINSSTDVNFGTSRCDISAPLEVTLTMGELRDMFTGNNVAFPPGSNQVVEGYVVSSDLKGNFYKNIFIQDKPVNPTAAVQIVVDEIGLYQAFPVGSKVLIKLDNLYLGNAFGDVLSLGYYDDDEVDRIDEGDIGNFLFPTGESTTIVPTPAKIGSSGPTIDELDENGNIVDDNNDGIANQIPAPEGILLNFDGVQLPSGEVGQAYAFYSGTDSANRTIVSCETSNTMILRNSGFADFAHEPFPEGRGNITAVLSRFFSTQQLVLRSTNDVDLDEQRCDPLFEEGFDEAVDNANLDIEGWINYAEVGSEVWTEQVYSGNGYAEFTAFNTGDALNVGWLITPGFDMDAQDGEILNFQTEYAYPDAGHYPLEVFVSTDFDGTEGGILSATWEPISAVIAHPDNTGSWFTWVNSGDIDLSGYSGTLYVAFKYTGSDTSNQNSTIHVENVKIKVQ